MDLKVKRTLSEYIDDNYNVYTSYILEENEENEEISVDYELIEEIIDLENYNLKIISVLKDEEETYKVVFVNKKTKENYIFSDNLRNKVLKIILNDSKEGSILFNFIKGLKNKVEVIKILSKISSLPINMEKWLENEINKLKYNIIIPLEVDTTIKSYCLEEITRGGELVYSDKVFYSLEEYNNSTNKEDYKEVEISLNNLRLSIFSKYSEFKDQLNFTSIPFYDVKNELILDLSNDMKNKLILALFNKEEINDYLIYKISELVNKEDIKVFKSYLRNNLSNKLSQDIIYWINR